MLITLFVFFTFNLILDLNIGIISLMILKNLLLCIDYYKVISRLGIIGIK